MDKKTIILVVALGVLVIFWMPIMTNLGLVEPPPVIETPVQVADTQTPTDNNQAEKNQPVQPTTTTSGNTQPMEIASDPSDTLPVPEERTITIETNVHLIVMSNYGGAPVSLKLKQYKYNDGGEIEMLPDCDNATPEWTFNNGNKSGNNFVFRADNPQESYSVTTGSVDISYTYTDPSGGMIAKTYSFFADKYEYDLKVEITNPDAMGLGKQYALEWNNKLAPTELNIEDDYTSMWAMAMMTDERVQFDDYDNDKFSISQDGKTNWIATRSKYFASILFPKSGNAAGAKASGLEKGINVDGESVTSRELAIGLIMDPPYGETIVDSFSVYVGPLDYNTLKNYPNNVVDLLDIGTTPYVGWIISLFAKPILYLLPAMYDIIPNYGFVIIIFAFLVKLITWPLSRKSVQSMAAMKDIQPKMTELKEKHKNNPQALNKEMMKLYKEHGVNPISGCLPMLPQMPLFFAMFAVFRSTILLRQAPFMLWWDDLSRGAMTLTDPYMILVVLMVGLMFLQQKMAMTDPKNKAMTYIFPLMLGFFFYKASAGLVLYWMMFSLFSWLEQILFKKTKKNPEIKTA